MDRKHPWLRRAIPLLTLWVTVDFSDNLDCGLSGTRTAFVLFVCTVPHTMEQYGVPATDLVTSNDVCYVGYVQDVG